MDEDYEAELREQFRAAGLDEDSIDEVISGIADLYEEDVS